MRSNKSMDSFIINHKVTVLVNEEQIDDMAEFSQKNKPSVCKQTVREFSEHIFLCGTTVESIYSAKQISDVLPNVKSQNSRRFLNH